ncbi:hypothetical protein [Mesoterricola silvestris]|uniref:hypothetical protein n=1 Tax=Mesoterricola silvestris TaxID=2927979 RepID=UPI002931AE8D|nr:hypothetical protein [Mesoterricola silvestris]
MNRYALLLIGFLVFCNPGFALPTGSLPPAANLVDGVNKLNHDNYSFQFRLEKKPPTFLVGALGHFRSRDNLCLNSFKILNSESEIDVPSVLLNVMCNPRTIRFEKKKGIEIATITGGDGGESYLISIELAYNRITKVVARYGESPDSPLWILTFPKSKSDDVLDK